MLLFDKRSPLVYGSQVEDNMFVATKVCKRSGREGREII